VLGLVAGTALGLGGTAAAAPRSPIDVNAGPLPAALHELAREAGVELIFDSATVRGRRAPAVRGTMTVKAALDRLLQGSSLRARRVRTGAFLIERAPPPRKAQPATPAQPAQAPPPEPPAADGLDIPEILVLGIRTQNSDIRRRENDVQPYQVATRRQILQAHRDDVDQYFRSRVTSNAQVLPPSLNDEGETLSEIDLRGLGSGGTLVLVDGRRLPSIPAWINDPRLFAPPSFGFRQPDVNAIPLHAIERIETLTGTAGGIYGFGALGGVVNIVLQRNYRGLELHGTTGISSRGDSKRVGLEGRLGFTPNGGRTDVMLYLSHAFSEPLRVGQRGHALRDLEALSGLAPDWLPTRRGNSVQVERFIGSQPLTFRPAYGGGTLGSAFTFLPAGFDGSPAELVQALKARSGDIDLTLSEGQAESGLGSTPTLTAALANVRHRFGGGVEGYFDALMTRNSGRHSNFTSWGSMLLFSGSPINPFNETIWLRFPMPDEFVHRRRTFTKSRFTAGLVADLPLSGWRGTAEATLGSTRVHALKESKTSIGIFLGPPLGPNINPLGDWRQFQSQVVIDPIFQREEARARTRYREQSLRLAGPVLQAPGGPVSLTLLAERRSERVPIFKTIRSQERASGRSEVEDLTGARSNVTTSFYGELRAPVFDEQAPVPLLDGLELQLAVRHDRLRASFDADPFDPVPGEIARHAFDGTSFTAGAKVAPLPWLILRGSYATGEQAPPLERLISREEMTDLVFAYDAKRGDIRVGEEGEFLHKFEGSPDLKTTRANTLSLGAVLNPEGRRGPRLSLDFSRIRKSRDALLLYGQLVLDHEEFWPERVTRAPLTDEDRARGYTGGRITMLDERAANGGSGKIDSIDGRLDWPVPFLGGKLRFYGAATVQLTNEQPRVFEPSLERAGYRNGPLKWRANGGADWSDGRTTLGANLQYFSRYRIVEALYVNNDPSELEWQGSLWVQSQAYLDLHASRRLALRQNSLLRNVEINLGIVNVLDRQPPREFGLPGSGPGYSRYGDPRGRRLELVLSAEY
jgi:outer membrane receptor protein involved in Fe transport